MYFSLIKFHGETMTPRPFPQITPLAAGTVSKPCLPAECLYENETAAPIRIIREPLPFFSRYLDIFSRCRPKWANSCIGGDIVSSRLGRIYIPILWRATSSNYSGRLTAPHNNVIV